MGLPALVFYGIGGMVGAGIYGTIGEAAGLLGNAVWISFLLAMCAALLTGLSYASLGSRYPRAAGVAYVTERAFGRPMLSYVIGLVVTASGLTSMATGANVFARTLHGFFPGLPHNAAMVGFLFLLTLLCIKGIRESMWANIGCTLIEVSGLVLVIVVGAKYWGSVSYVAPAPGTTLSASLLFSGAVLTFYAFIGFEDMLNVSEEVENPVRNVPRGILIALGITTLLYIAVAITAVSVVPSQELADPTRGAPLVQLTSRAAPWLPVWVYGVITLFAVGNTALLNFIMGSRMLYGMSKQTLLPAWLGTVSPRTRTPVRASAFLFGLVVLLGLSGTVRTLASATSLLLLGCFAVVNCALIVLRLRKQEASGGFEIPIWIPALGAVVCLVLIGARLLRAGAEAAAPLIAGGLVVVIAGLYLIGSLRARRI